MSVKATKIIHPTDFNNNPAHSNHIFKRTWVNIAVVVLVIAICAGGYIYYHNHHSGHQPTFSQQYSSYLYAHSITGSASGNGVGFGLPAPFLQLHTTDSSSSNVRIAFNDIPSGTLVPIGGAYADSNAYLNGQVPPAGYLKNYDSQLKEAVKSTIDAQEQLAKSVLKSTHFASGNISITSLKSFTNPNIKQAAWVADFSAGNSKFPPQDKGRMVSVRTNKATYNFYVYAYDYNWDTAANQQIWQKVFDSLKVDQ